MSIQSFFVVQGDALSDRQSDTHFSQLILTCACDLFVPFSLSRAG